MDKQIQEQIEAALNSLEGVERAQARPFMFTRVMARLEREPAGWWDRLGIFITRPAVAIASVLLILLVNGLVLFNRPAGGGNENTGAVNTDNREMALTDEYELSRNAYSYITE